MRSWLVWVVTVLTLAALASFGAAEAVTIVDSFFDVFVELTLDGGPVTLTGPAQFRNGALPGPSDPPIPIELVQMSLTGTGPITLTGVSSSGGQIAPGSGGTFDSFFDVFFEIQLPSPPTLHNQQPLHLERLNDPKPPFGTGIDLQGLQIPLLDTQSQSHGVLTRAQFTPTPEPTTLLLLGSGMIAFGARAWRRGIPKTS